MDSHPHHGSWIRVSTSMSNWMLFDSVPVEDSLPARIMTKSARWR